MRRTAAILLGTLALAAAVRAHDIPPASAAGPLLLAGGDLYTVASGVLPGHDLLIVDGRIAAIGVGLALPEGARRIDVSGQRVYPGLVALQSTLGLVEIDAVRATVDTTEIGEIAPEAAAHVAWNPDSEILPTVRAHGIAVAQTAPRPRFGAPALLSGRSFVVRLDGWTREDAGLRATWGLQLTWPAAAPRRGFGGDPPPDDFTERRRERLARLERSFDAALAHHLRRTADPSAPLDLRWEAMRPVLAGEEPLFVQAEDAREIAEALDFAARRALRLVLVGGAEAGELAERLAAADVPVVVGATQRLPHRRESPYDEPFALPARLAAAGVRFALAMPGESWATRGLPFQAGQAIAFGLDPEAALRAVTATAAELAGVGDRLGTLEVGKEGTVVVSRGDLLDPLTQRVTHLVIAGREVDLDHRHRRLYEKYSRRLAPEADAQ